MCAPAIGLAGSVLGSVGQFASGSAAASAQNKAAIGQYKYQLKMRRLAWQDTRQQYATKLGQYGNQLAANTEAANIAYAGQQRKLNDIYKKAAFSQQAQLVQLAQGSGKMAAAGRLGKSAERLDLDVVRQFGRNKLSKLSHYLVHSMDYRMLIVELGENYCHLITKHLVRLLSNLNQV